MEQIFYIHHMLIKASQRAPELKEYLPKIIIIF